MITEEIQALKEKQYKLITELSKLGQEIEEIAKKESDLYPELNETYFWLTASGTILKNEWKNTNHDRYLADSGNCYPNLSIAKYIKNNFEIKAQLKKLAKELNKGQPIDWDNINQIKYCLTSCRVNGNPQINLSSTKVLNYGGTIYCLSPKFLDKALEQIGEKALIQYIQSGV